MTNNDETPGDGMRDVVKCLRDMIDAVEAGAIDSPAIVNNETGEKYAWHSEWLHHAKAALAKQTSEAAGDEFTVLRIAKEMEADYDLHHGTGGVRPDFIVSARAHLIESK